MNTTRISLWSGPRNISTALMYSFAQRADTLVFDEPLYGYYLEHSPAKTYHPGADEIIASMDTNGQNVVDMMCGPHDKPVAFFKNMTHHILPELDLSFLKNLVNVILTRDPVEMIPSFAKVIDQPKISDIGYAQHVELLEKMEEMGIKPIVLDSKQVLLTPKSTLSNLCDRIGIPFDEHMLHWQPGARPEDGIWAKYWYSNVHESVGFQPYKPKETPFPDHLKPLLEECIPYYEKLKEYAL